MNPSDLGRQRNDDDGQPINSVRPPSNILADMRNRLESSCISTSTMTFVSPTNGRTDITKFCSRIENVTSFQQR